MQQKTEVNKLTSAKCAILVTQYRPANPSANPQTDQILGSNKANLETCDVEIH